MDIVGILVTVLVTALALLIVSRIPFLGVEVDSFGKALIAAVIFGLLNAFLRPVLGFLAFPITFLTLGLFAFVLNGIIFGLAAWLVEGFRLRYGILSAIGGAIFLSLVNSLLWQVIGLATR